MIIWKKIKKLGPNEGDLKHIIDLPAMYALPKILSQAQKLLRDRSKKKTRKIIKKIKELIDEIKKGQE